MDITTLALAKKYAKETVEESIEGAQSGAEAAQSAKKAAESASAASTSETNAKASETAAKASETAAAGSASAARQSATSAAESAAVYDDVVADVNQLKQDLGIVIDTNVDYVQQPLTIEKKRYYGNVGKVVLSVDESRMAAKVIVSEGEIYRISTYISSSALISGIIYLDSNDVILGKELTGVNSSVADYEFTIPSNCASVIVQNAIYNSTSFIYLKKRTETKTSKSYTREESDGRYQPIIHHELAKKYGVKWEIGNSDDLGQRCFDAVGLTASIGIGETDGSSDFDSIYPWSEIKRCNIKRNDNGASIITFEGEDGFALDGSNGDIFVRIPKFYYEHFKQDGYEFYVVSDSGRSLHPCFVEDGIELDEIFVGAFEGYVNDGKLTSVADVIPTSNITPVEFLSAAKANGANYTLYDMRTVSAIWVLMAVEYGCRNSNRILGYGASDYYQPVASGRSKAVISSQGANSITTAYWTDAQKNFMPIGTNITICGNNDQKNILTQAKLISASDDADKTQTTFTFDGPPIDVDTSCFIGSAALSTNFTETCSSPLSWHTGRADFVSGSNKKNPIRYRWIENIFGNLWHYLPDVTFSNLQMYVCKSMKDYEMFSTTGAYKPVSDLFSRQEENGSKSDNIGVNFWVNEMSDDHFSNGVMFGKSFDMQLTSKKAFGAFYYLKSSIATIANGGGFDHLYRCNILTHRAWISDSTKWYLYGARLLYKHIS